MPLSAQTPLQTQYHTAILVLADGTTFVGYSIGVAGQTVGEVAFNTAVLGYQETLTTPSMAGQLLAFTYTHIGSYGMNADDAQSATIHAAGVIVRDVPLLESNFRSQNTIGAYLHQHHIVAIGGIDTRELTRHIRTCGNQNGCIIALDNDAPPRLDLIEYAQAQAQCAPSVIGRDMVQAVTCAEPFEWTQGQWTLEGGFSQPEADRFHVVVYDFGVAYDTLRLFKEKGCRVTVVPAQTAAKDVLAMQPDGVVLSHGAGDASACDYAIEAVAALLQANTPLFALGLGLHILALAGGARIRKLKVAHHGSNHPVKNLSSNRVGITAQSHRFVIDETSLPDTMQRTHTSLFDGSIQGIAYTDKAAFGFQGQPLSWAEPDDCASLWARFVAHMQAAKSAAATS